MGNKLPRKHKKRYIKEHSREKYRLFALGKNSLERTIKYGYDSNEEEYEDYLKQIEEF